MHSTFYWPLLLSIALLILGFTPNLQSQSSTTNSNPEIAKFFENWNQPHQSGGAIAVVHKGKMVYANGFGSADLENQIPITSTTKFNLQSLQNQVVSFAVLLLESEGQLSQEDDIRKYIPEMPDLGNPIKIKHLLTHTHGLPDFMVMQLVAGWTMEDIKTRKEALNLIYSLEEMVAVPGDHHDFCVTGFLLASEIVERVSGMPFSTFAKTKLFDPLGMANSTYLDGAHELVQNRAKSYDAKGDGFKNKTENYYCLNDFTLYSTVEDMAKWMLNFSNPKVGNATVIKKMDAPIKLNDGSDTEAAPGQFLGEYKGLRKVEHNGMAYGNLAYISRFPDQDFGVVVLGNAYHFSAKGVGLKAVDLYLKDYFNETAPKNETTTTSIGEPKTIAMNAKELEKFCGAFWNTENSYSRQIILRDGKLFYQRSESNESELAPINKNTFVLTANPSAYQIRFENKEGKDIMIFAVDDYEYRHEKYERTSYTANQLKSFSGSYYCDNLGAIYKLKMKDNKLVASHFRKGDIYLMPTLKDRFGGDLWYFSNIIFERNNKDQIIGFRLKTANAGNHFFRKI